MGDAVAAWDTLFSLTLTLSRKEREPQWPRLGQCDAIALSRRCELFSLSPGERAGVRGNKV